MLTDLGDVAGPNKTNKAVVIKMCRKPSWSELGALMGPNIDQAIFERSMNPGMHPG